VLTRNYRVSTHILARKLEEFRLLYCKTGDETEICSPRATFFKDYVMCRLTFKYKQTNTRSNNLSISESPKKSEITNESHDGVNLSEVYSGRHVRSLTESIPAWMRSWLKLRDSGHRIKDARFRKQPFQRLTCYILCESYISQNKGKTVLMYLVFANKIAYSQIRT
jgi:hypothetical protein